MRHLGTIGVPVGPMRTVIPASVRADFDGPRSTRRERSARSIVALVQDGSARRWSCYKLWPTELSAKVQDFKSHYPRRIAYIAFIAFCGACNALLDNHPRDLEVVAPGAGGEPMVSPGAAGEGGSENTAGEAGTSGASGGSDETPEGGSAGSENEPAGGRAGSPTGGTAGVSHGGTSQGGMAACTGCTPGATEPQTRACGICNAGKESGTRKCTAACTWETSWSGTCSDHGNASNGCSVVKWCTNDAGRTECTLLGCTAKEAQDECRDEATSICGTVKNLLMTNQCP